MVTNTQKVLVQESFAAVMPIADDAAALFYRRLFELDPSLQRMFKGDMTEQRRKLVQIAHGGRQGPRSPRSTCSGCRRARTPARWGTAWRMRTTTPSARRCSGPWKRGWKRLHTRGKGHGSRCTACSPAR